MFWADKVASQLKERKLPIEWVDDMKTPSGKVHVGSLCGVVYHGLVYQTLKEQGVNAKYTYVFENHDPMDDIPSYLSREKYEKYLGMPLFRIPSPVEGYENFADYYASDFQNTFNAMGFYPEILWTKDLYTSGKMNKGIKTVLDNAQKIREIYQELYKKKIPIDWYPFQAYCSSCGKVSTTRVYKWDREFVYYRCVKDAVKWTGGCGFEGKTSPFSDEKGMYGKMPWKVEWPVKWQAIGVTVEGAGKDHMSAGGSHDLASLVCERVLHYSVPYPVSYEFILIGGKKMSSSKGRGYSAADILTILPPTLARFLFVKKDISKQEDFDPSEKDTIPKLFDEYQEYARHFFDEKKDDEARIFQLSQIGDVKKPPMDVRFRTLAQWVQMPNMEETIKKEGLEEWTKYAGIWLEKFAPEDEKFVVQENLPQSASKLLEKQKEYLRSLTKEDFEQDVEKLHIRIYDIAKEVDISSKDAFSSIYISLLGKDHGPKAAWLIKSLDQKFVKERFILASQGKERHKTENRVQAFDNPGIFSIDQRVLEKFPTISAGIAVIRNVSIEKVNSDLEKEKKELLSSLEGLTTDQLGKYPEIMSYRKLYKEMGVDWHSRRPSPEALLRRVALKKGLYDINTCVDSYNLIVMKNRISVGAFDLDKIAFPTKLQFAKDEDEILLLGDTQSTKYKETELAYFDQTGGYNIDFNFRDAKRTAAQLDTKNLYINVDGVFDITPQQVGQSLKEVCDMIVKYCGGTLDIAGVVTGNK